MIDSSRGAVDVGELIAAARSGHVRAVARLITLVETESASLRAISAGLVPHAGRAQVIGLTGPPGVGKSTSTSVLIGALRARGLSVGVLAVDPTSPFSGGALLGDRIRMQEHATDSGVFIRSMASRGHLGGLSAAVPQAVRVLDAAGFDVVLIETVGVGQAEFEIASLADTTVLVLAPGLGDGIQAAKAGILEIADVLVVNKADRDGAATLARDLRHMQALGAQEAGWTVPIVSTVASRGEGIEQLLEAIERHRDVLAATGELQRRRCRRAATEIEAIALGQVRAQFTQVRGSALLAGLAAQVVAGHTDPHLAAAELLAGG